MKAPSPRGWPGRGWGAAITLEAPEEFRGTTVQVCGLWPFAAGAATPTVGVPVGRHLITGATVCCDPISWFQRARLIANPSAFVLGKPGLGKSTIVRRIALGLAGYGVHAVVLGDLRPDYVDLVTALGGQVLSLGHGRGSLNILDRADALDAAAHLTGQARADVLADAHARRHALLASLVTILRSAPPTDREDVILDRALRVLDDAHPHPEGQPVLADLLHVLRAAPDPVPHVAVDRGDLTRYRDLIDPLEATLTSLASGGRLGGVFARPSTVTMRRDRSVVFDMSAIGDGESDLQAAALLACWSYGFGVINAANALADAGAGPRRHYLVVMDELWRALRAGPGIVDRVDVLTRLNRGRGVGQIMVSHTLTDLLALTHEADRHKARGFVERAGMVIAAGLPAAEMPHLRSVVALSRTEEALLTSWQDPPAWDPATGADTAPPGRGRFLIKVGGRPGIPVEVTLTAVERTLGINDTDRLWHQPASPVMPAGRAARPQ
ncbi:MAG: ATP/GTP-binding protein [Kineosporiaceae bacterium]